MLVQRWLKCLFLKQLFSLTLSSLWELNNSQLHRGDITTIHSHFTAKER